MELFTAIFFIRIVLAIVASIAFPRRRYTLFVVARKHTVGTGNLSIPRAIHFI